MVDRRLIQTDPGLRRGMTIAVLASQQGDRHLLHG